MSLLGRKSYFKNYNKKQNKPNEYTANEMKIS